MSYNFSAWIMQFWVLNSMRWVFAGLLTTVLGAATAGAEPSTFPGSDYGSVTLRLRESQGSAVSEVIERGDIFQRVGRLRPDDRLRTVSDAVVRLDRLLEIDGRSVTSTCTGTIVAPDLVLTNFHCIPGLGERIRQASILIGYEDEDDPDAVRVPIETTPVAADNQLDFALVRITAPLPPGVRPVELVTGDAQPGERLTVLHHPAGRPKMMTVHECFAFGEASPRPSELRHVCDTLPGSSGGLLVDVDRRPVGLHHTGGLRKGDAGSYNLATRMSVVRDALNGLRPGATTATGAATGVAAGTRQGAGTVASRTSGSSYERERPTAPLAAGTLPALGDADRAFQEPRQPQPPAGVTAGPARPSSPAGFEGQTPANVQNRITDAFANE